MSGTPNSRQQIGRFITLLFHQVNVRKGEWNMDIARQKAWDAEAHMAMVQEPWAMEKYGEYITKSYSGYICRKPIGTRGARPRAITFSRKGIHAT